MTQTKQGENQYQSIGECLDQIIDRLDRKVCIAIGCGTGKPVNFINALYLRAKKDPTINLTILSALTLEKPKATNSLQKRLLEPMMSRIFEDAPDFEHVIDLRNNRLPKNVTLYEWMFPPGKFLMHNSAQRIHVAGNFSDAPRDIINKDINILCHLAASAKINGQEVISAAGNSDVIPPVIAWIQQQKKYKEKLIIAEVNEKAPFLWGDMVYSPDQYDYIFKGESFNQMPFCPPKEPISDAAHMIGFYASLLVKDDGTLQVGIGSLGDAINNALIMRHRHNDKYLDLIKSSGIRSHHNELLNKFGGDSPFEKGLFCNSEMFVDSFLNLYDEGIIKRKVYDEYPIQKLINRNQITTNVNTGTVKALWDDGAIGNPLRKRDIDYLINHGILASDVTYDQDLLLKGHNKVSTNLNEALSDELFESFLGTQLNGGELIHATLMIAPKQMHKRLGRMSLEEKKLFSLRNTKFVNTLYGDEKMKREQRKNGRFMNFTLIATLFGAVASETINHQQVVSGIGGQLDLVIMANAMDDARSILLLNATRGDGKKVQSSIVFEYSACSIPRQMRDIIVTEYGIADLQGLNDEQCAIEMLKIADSRFQDSLLYEAKKYKKIAHDYVLPDEYKNNYPTKISGLLKEFKQEGFYGPFPFGSDLTDEEYKLGKALKKFVVDLRDNKISTFLRVAAYIFAKSPKKFQNHLVRMDLNQPKNIDERFQRAIVISALDKMTAMAET